MGRANGFGLALKAPRKLAGGKPPAPPPETRSRVEPALARWRVPGAASRQKTDWTGPALRPTIASMKPDRRNLPKARLQSQPPMIC